MGIYLSMTFTISPAISCRRCSIWIYRKNSNFGFYHKKKHTQIQIVSETQMRHESIHVNHLRSLPLTTSTLTNFYERVWRRARTTSTTIHTSDSKSNTRSIRRVHTRHKCKWCGEVRAAFIHQNNVVGLLYCALSWYAVSVYSFLVQTYFE